LLAIVTDKNYLEFKGDHFEVSFLFLLDFFLAKKFFNFFVVNACKNLDRVL